MSSEINPCPFCGSKQYDGLTPEDRTKGNVHLFEDHDGWYISCDNYDNDCPAPTSQHYQHKWQAVEAWNSRHITIDVRGIARQFFSAGFSIGYGGADINDKDDHFLKVWDMLSK